MSIYYARLPHIKAAISGSSSLGTTVDDELLRLADRVARSFESEMGRRFYQESATAYYNGSGTGILHLTIAARERYRADLQSITTCKQDEGADGTFERTLTENTHFWLASPLNGAYRKLEMTPYSSNTVGVFQKGQRTVEIVGVFGVPGVTETVGTAAEALDASETEIDVALASSYYNGDTIKIDDEQMLVTATTDAAQDTLTVTRGVNGTTAATHSTGATISRLLAPEPVQQYLIQEIARWWREQSTGAGGAPGGLSGMGSGFNYRVSYAVVKALADLYRIPGAY